MRVLAVCKRAWYGIGPSGGAETMLADLVEHLVGQGWDAEALFLDPEKQSHQVNGVRVQTRRTSTDFDDLAARADIIITHLSATPMARKAGQKFNKPVVQLVHNTNQFTVGFLGSGCDLAIYNAEWVRDFHENARAQRVIQVWESRYTAAFKVRTTMEWPSVLVRPPVLAKELLNSTGEHITLVNLTPNKGPDVFYKLAEMNPDLKFMGVIGGYEPGQQDIRDLPNVTIHPHTANQDEFYSKTSVILTPSVYESYGRVGVEAMQYGIPTLSSPTPGLQESLSYSGTFADREDINAWNAGLHTVLANRQEKCQLAHKRFLELADQSTADLEDFSQKMEEVGRARNGNR